MPKAKKKESVPPELREELIKLALATDCVAEHRIEGWRESAICAARWLLRAAALSDDMPREFSQAFKTIAEISNKLRKNPEIRTETDELLELLEKYRLASLKGLS